MRSSDPYKATSPLDIELVIGYIKKNIQDNTELQIRYINTK